MMYKEDELTLICSVIHWVHNDACAAYYKRKNSNSSSNKYIILYYVLLFNKTYRNAISSSSFTPQSHSSPTCVLYCVSLLLFYFWNGLNESNIYIRRMNPTNASNEMNRIVRLNQILLLLISFSCFFIFVSIVLLLLLLLID